MAWDKDRNLRKLTLRFFEQGMESLVLLRKDFETYPEERATRRRWVDGIREFANRAQRLADEWESRLAEDMESEKPEANPLARIHNNKKTPRA